MPPGIEETKMAIQSIKTVANPKERHHKTYWNHIPELIDRETLQFLLDTDLTIQNIADRLGCSRSNVVSAMKSHGLERRKLIIPESMKKKLRV